MDETSHTVTCASSASKKKMSSSSFGASPPVPRNSESEEDLSAVEIVRHACPQSEEDAAAWTQVLITKPSLATFTKRVAHKGFATKRGPTNRNLWNWNRVFLLLQYPFLSYFASNDPATRCLGLVYIAPPCIIRALPHYPGRKHVLQVKPSVRRNLHHKSVDDDEDNFYFSFESAEMLAAWQAELSSEIARGVQEATDGDVLQDDDILQPMSLHSMDLKDAATALKALDGGQQGRTNKVSSMLLLDNEDNEGNTIDDKHRSKIDQPPHRDVDSLASVSEDSSSPQGRQGLMGRTGSVDDDLVSNRSSASRRSASQKSSILPRYTESSTRRRSFFAADELVDCYNSEAVHRTHCTRCKASPVIGFLYTCAVCEQPCELCASCFRTEDHDVRHLFLVSPDIEGECLRVLPPLEGGPFRISELILFEALFRIVGSDFDGQPTNAMSKRRLLTFWNALDHQSGNDASRHSGGSSVGSQPMGSSTSIAPNVAGPPHLSLPIQMFISERDLTLLCRDPDNVTFQEFMFLVRCKLASKASYYYFNTVVLKQHATKDAPPLALLPPDGAFVYIALAFALLNRMLQAYRHGVEGVEERRSDDHIHSAENPISKILPLLKPYEDALRRGGLAHAPVKTNGNIATIIEPSKSSANKPQADPYVSQLEEATLQMLLGACSIVTLAASEEMIPIALYTQILRSIHLVASRNSPQGVAVVREEVVLQQVAEDFPPSDEWLREDDEELLPSSEVRKKALARWRSTFMEYSAHESAAALVATIPTHSDPSLDNMQRSKHATSLTSEEQRRMVADHRLIDVVEHVLAYEVGGALGLYTDQPESIHCEVCSCCNATPIVGFMYVEVRNVTEGEKVKTDQPNNNDDDGALHFCQSCMSGKRWTTAIPPAIPVALRSTSSNLSMRSANSASATTITTTPSSATHTIHLRRVPGDVITSYDRASGKVASVTSALSRKNQRRTSH